MCEITKAQNERRLHPFHPTYKTSCSSRSKIYKGDHYPFHRVVALYNQIQLFQGNQYFIVLSIF